MYDIIYTLSKDKYAGTWRGNLSKLIVSWHVMSELKFNIGGTFVLYMNAVNRAISVEIRIM